MSRRAWGKRVAVPVLLALAATVIVIAVSSLTAWREYREDVAAFHRYAALVEDGGSTLREKLDAFAGMRARMQRVSDGVATRPLGLRIVGIGDGASPELEERYAALMESQFAEPCTSAVAERLRNLPADAHVERYALLRQYKAAVDPVLADEPWLTGRYALLWVQTAGGDLDDDRLAAREEVAFYLRSVRDRRAPPVRLDDEVIEMARAPFLRMEPDERLRWTLIEELSDRRIDESLPADAENLRYRAVSWDSIVNDHPGLDRYLDVPPDDLPTKHIIPGMYRRDASREIDADQAKKSSVASELLGVDDDHRVPHVVGRYWTELKSRWRGFISLFVLRAPATVAEAEELYGMLGNEVSPLKDILELAIVGPPRPSDSSNVSLTVKDLQPHPDRGELHIAAFMDSFSSLHAQVARLEPTEPFSSLAPTIVVAHGEMKLLVHASRLSSEDFESILLGPLDVGRD